MANFNFPFMFPFPIPAAITGSCHFSTFNDFSLEDDDGRASKFTAGIFNGLMPNVPQPTDRSFGGSRQFPEYHITSNSYNRFRPESLHTQRSIEQQAYGIDESEKPYEPSYYDYTSSCRGYDTNPCAPSTRSSPGLRLPGLSELFFGKANMESHRSPRKRRRRGSTFEHNPSRFLEVEISNCEELTTNACKTPFIYRDANTAKSHKKVQREISTDCEDQEMNQSSEGSSRQRMQHGGVEYEEPDPCPEKYRDPLWEEHVKNEESSTRSAKGKEKADPLDPVYYNSCNESEQFLSQPYNISNEANYAHARGFSSYDLPPAEDVFLKRMASSPERTYFHSGSPGEVGTKMPKRYVNYSRNFNNPHINKRDPYALSYDELKRARQSLQREREALNVAKESLASDRMQFDADRWNAGYHANAFSAFNSHFQRVTGLLGNSGIPYQNSGDYDMGPGEQSSYNHSYYDEPWLEGESSSIHSRSPDFLQNQRPDRARQMLDRYNRAWEVLDIRDTNVPYPTPSGTINELRDPNNIFSPLTSPPSTWTRDKIMQVNAETFYQRGFGIRPMYKEYQGKLRTLAGLPIATDKQLRELETYLKKERNRWHPDKLLLRNGEGQVPSTNNMLTTSPAASAVLLAIHETLNACREEIARRTEIYQNCSRNLSPN